MLLLCICQDTAISPAGNGLLLSCSCKHISAQSECHHDAASHSKVVLQLPANPDLLCPELPPIPAAYCQVH